MRVLILGGTEFLGRHLVDAALQRGHEVTLFNRGQSNPDLFPNVEKLKGNRDGNLHALHGRTWDAAIDTSGYIPRIVRDSVNLLKDAVEHYTFISSISVYADFSQTGMDENGVVETLHDKSNENISEHYGALKALCEQEVTQEFRGRALIVRPGLIVGPFDPTNRFTYWVRRFYQGGSILVPEPRHAKIQFIDARDLANWTIRSVEKHLTGIFNATGPDYELTMGHMVEMLGRFHHSSAEVVWVSEEFLLQEDVREFEELPLWISEKTNWPGFMTIDVKKATDNGLSFRSLEDSILDTLHWELTRQPGLQSTRPQSAGHAGMQREREEQLLHKFFSKS
ncbi:SDR family oxidoreductase [Alicyclobacillus sp. SO9]|uniref:SDR family oxidoreductase n=1 Tax=Alicyclobacillus sp. SO9 TaxID=2665646 RepID=UPI0018E77AC5|nr:SDR family oxidoreductase [Alicyclobacillus sp. SO9]QQE76808.1 SDR family oxidoreductase [Alicyclobacillus sp. SO9]